MSEVINTSDFLEESIAISRLEQPLKGLAEDFESGELSAGDLKALRIRLDRVTTERGGRRIRLARFKESMPKTGIWVNDEGKYCSEHYSSKPGLEVYGSASFDTPQELFRHIWLRVVKNGIPASLMSKRNVNEKIDFDKMFPPGNSMTMEEILNQLKPMLGGEKLANPSNSELVKDPMIERLINLGLIGREGNSEKETVVSDITKGGKIKYYFYCSAIERIDELYGRLIEKIADVNSSESMGLIPSRKSGKGRERWTVTNTQRMPINSVNFRTGENILVCRLQDPEMFSAIFIAIIKRTFKRARGRKEDEKLIHPGWRSENPKLIEELNDLLSDYFAKAAEEIDPTVFIDEDMESTSVKNNAKALLIKHLLRNGSEELKEKIKGNSELEEYVRLTTKHEDLDVITKKLIRVYKSLKYA